MPKKIEDFTLAELADVLQELCSEGNADKKVWIEITGVGGFRDALIAEVVADEVKLKVL